MTNKDPYNWQEVLLSNHVSNLKDAWRKPLVDAPMIESKYQAPSTIKMLRRLQHMRNGKR